MKAIKVYFFPKNSKWIGKRPWYIVGTEHQGEAIEKARARLRVDEPLHHHRYKPICAYCEILQEGINMAMIWIGNTAFDVPEKVADYIAEIEIENGKLTKVLEDITHAESAQQRKSANTEDVK